METYPRKTLDKLVEEQITRWQSNRKRKYKKPIRPVITISRFPGCNAWNIAKQISEALEIDFFDQEIVDEIAKNADVNRRVWKPSTNRTTQLFLTGYLPSLRSAISGQMNTSIN